MYGLTQTVAPTESPCTVAEAKLHARLDDDAVDTDVQTLIDAATEEIEGLIDRQIVQATWKLTLPCFPDVFRLPLGLAQSITSIQYYDTDNAIQTVSSDDYIADLVRVPPVIISDSTNKDWPSTYDRPDAVLVTWVAGYGAAAAVPAGLKVAVMMLFTHRWEHRGDDAVTEMTGARVAADVPQNIIDLAMRYEVGDEWWNYNAPNTRAWGAYS